VSESSARRGLGTFVRSFAPYYTFRRLANLVYRFVLLVTVARAGSSRPIMLNLTILRGQPERARVASSARLIVGITDYE
jgi:hypothetical protein